MAWTPWLSPVASPAHAKASSTGRWAGDARALARLLSLVEDESPRMRAVIKDLLP